MSSAPFDIQIPATEIQIAEAIRLACPEEADVIRRLAFERDRLKAAMSLLKELVDPEPCRYDHHGHCQENMHLTTETRCPHARAKDMLEKNP